MPIDRIKECVELTMRPPFDVDALDIRSQSPHELRWETDLLAESHVHVSLRAELDWNLVNGFRSSRFFQCLC